MEWEAFGAAQEQELLLPMIEGTRKNFETTGNKQDVFEKVKLTADSEFHTEANMKGVMAQGIDAYIAGTQFRKWDSRFSDVDKYEGAMQKREGGVLRSGRPIQAAQGFYDQRRKNALYLSRG